RVAGAMAGPVVLLRPTEAGLGPGGARNRPGPRERLGVALVGKEPIAVVRLGREHRLDGWQRLDIRDEPGLGAVREVRVREQEDGRAVLHGDARRLDRRGE